MKFILETPAGKERLTFEDVEDNQFFVTLDGELCQKIGCSSYSMVALDDGTPHADYFDANCASFGIKRILPKVVKIEF